MYIDKTPLPSRQRAKIERWIKVNWRAATIVAVLALMLLGAILADPEPFYWVDP